MTAALAVESVTVRFGGNVAVEDVSLDAVAGEVTGLIGPNGAGKTTLFNVVSGLQAPTSGRVLLGGRDVSHLGPHKRARAGLARTFQRLELFGVLTAHGNVAIAARGSADPAVLLARVGAAEVAEVRADQLPTGQARLVELARALATEPTVLLLDEPASGLSEDETLRFGELLREVAATGTAVVLVEHDVSLVFSVCHTVHVLDRGKLLASGPAAEVRADPRVLDAYLGAQ